MSRRGVCVCVGWGGGGAVRAHLLVAAPAVDEQQRVVQEDAQAHGLAVRQAAQHRHHVLDQLRGAHTRLGAQITRISRKGPRSTTRGPSQWCMHRLAARVRERVLALGYRATRAQRFSPCALLPRGLGRPKESPSVATSAERARRTWLRYQTVEKPLTSSECSSSQNLVQYDASCARPRHAHHSVRAACAWDAAATRGATRCVRGGGTWAGLRTVGPHSSLGSTQCPTSAGQILLVSISCKRHRRSPPAHNKTARRAGAGLRLPQRRAAALLRPPRGAPHLGLQALRLAGEEGADLLHALRLRLQLLGQLGHQPLRQQQGQQHARPRARRAELLMPGPSTRTDGAAPPRRL